MKAEFRPVEHTIRVPVTANGALGRAILETAGHIYVGGIRVSDENPPVLRTTLSEDKARLLALILTTPNPEEA